jgi:hypothetical protein
MAGVLGSGSWWRTPLKVTGLAAAASAALLAFAAEAAAQTTPPERSEGWKDATNILTISAVGVQLLMPRVFYSDPEVTVGWKARWHVSVLAPTMTLVTLGLLNEQFLKDEFEGFRPGCDEDNQGLVEGCDSYGMLSTHSFITASTFGQGLGIFIMDTAKWSGGRFNAGSFAGSVGVPAVLTVVTAVGRTAGDWESAGQSWGSAGIGALVGFGMGALYGAMQRPECGYEGGLICW